MIVLIAATRWAVCVLLHSVSWLE